MFITEQRFGPSLGPEGLPPGGTSARPAHPSDLGERTAGTNKNRLMFCSLTLLSYSLLSCFTRVAREHGIDQVRQQVTQQRADIVSRYLLQSGDKRWHRTQVVKSSEDGHKQSAERT